MESPIFNVLPFTCIDFGKFNKQYYEFRIVTTVLWLPKSYMRRLTKFVCKNITCILSNVQVVYSSIAYPTFIRGSCIDDQLYLHQDPSRAMTGRILR